MPGQGSSAGRARCVNGVLRDRADYGPFDAATLLIGPKQWLTTDTHGQPKLTPMEPLPGPPILRGEARQRDGTGTTASGEERVDSQDVHLRRGQRGYCMGRAHIHHFIDGMVNFAQFWQKTMLLLWDIKPECRE